jgi:hypothetical protein
MNHTGDPPAATQPSMTHISRTGARALVLALWAGAWLGSCRTTAHDLPQLYEQSLREQGRMRTVDDFERQTIRDVDRRAKVMQLVEQGRIVTAQDHFYAAALLVISDELPEVEKARDLGLRAAVLGDPRGLPVAAEAMDRALLKQGLPQRYGTQYVYEPVLKRWSLYAWDEKTTDADRRAMRVPTLDEAIARLDELNRERPFQSNAKTPKATKP